MNTEDRSEGGLAVEDRAAEAGPTIEQRVLDGLRSVRPGEARSLTTSTADPIAPPELSTFLFDRLRASSVALAAGIRVVPTDRESVQWPQITADVAPTWYGETDTITPGDPAFATLTATPRKLAHIVELSNEVIDDSEPAVVDVLNAHLATVLALKLDLSIFEGNPAGNANSIRGIKYTAGIQVVNLGTNGAALTSYDALVEAVGMLRAANVPGPYAVVAHPRTVTDLALLKDETGSARQLARPADVPEIVASSQLSVTETKGTASNASSAYVFAPAQLVLVRRQDAAIELDRSRLFNQDMSELRGKLRADLLVPNPSAVVRVEGVVPA
jgi:HK97 family phage major capsid protein